ncbi:MAG: helix-turn-helix domain-containing protein, partial [Acetobacteraceae bacterium]|nr:helix-turn-helix domain-containing protein [Acetobacteraceae bacterium]
AGPQPPRLPAGAPPVTADAEATPPPPRPVIEPLHVVEKRMILAALEETGNDVPRAAALLAINPSTIYRKLAAWKG